MSAVEESRLKGLITDFHPFSLVVTNPALEDNPIVYVNRAFERVTGYNASAVIGRNCRFLQGRDTSQSTIRKMREAIRKEEPVTVNLLNYRADGEPFWNNLHLEPVRDENGEVLCFLGVQKVLTEEPAPEGQGVDQQLREIQHRVKNHLQMIVSMIRMQAGSGGRTAGDDYKALSRRVEALQILYSEMHDDRAEEPASEYIMLGAYLSRIATAISYLETRNEIQLNMDIEPVRVRIDMAGRVGLIASEILTNCYQHAFTGKSQGIVDVRLSKLSSGALRLQISDDGNGLPEDSDWPHTGSMGAKIVQSLINGINAEMTITRPMNGTVFTIDLPPMAEPETGVET
nr:PAS domain-containing protein [Aquisalinus flavus]